MNNEHHLTTTEENSSESERTGPPSLDKNILLNYMPLFRTLYEFEWWWEIGAVVLSLISFSLILSILFQMNSKPLESWKFPIQINSLIAVFSTLSKSALLVALSGGLSQLKWNHFEKRGRPLNQLQYFDNASRGPWGSSFSPIAAMGAFLTVVSLAMEPFTQQIIDISTRSVALKNATISIPRALALVGDEKQKVLTEPKNIVIMVPQSNATTDAQQEDNVVPTCLTRECHFPAYWSLASCVECFDEEPPEPLLFLTYRLNYHNSSCSLLNETAKNIEAFKKIVSKLDSFTDNCPSNATEWFKPSYAMAYPSAGLKVNGVKIDTFIKNRSIKNFMFGKYHETSHTAYYPVFMDWFSLRASPPLPPLDQLEGWGGSSIKFRRCRLSLCGRRGSETVIQDDKVTREPPTYVQLNISKGSSRADPKMLLDLIPRDNHDAPIFQVQWGILKAMILEGRSMQDNLLAEALMRHGNGVTSLDTIFNNSNTVMNSFIVSSSNKNTSEVYGKAYRSETYVVVRWPWAILPCSVVLLSFAFLAITIIESGTKQQIYKMSTLIGYFNGLDGWMPEEMESVRDGMRWHEREDVLSEKAGVFKGKLMRNAHGDLKFVKVE